MGIFTKRPELSLYPIYHYIQYLLHPEIRKPLFEFILRILMNAEYFSSIQSIRQKFLIIEKS